MKRRFNLTGKLAILLSLFGVIAPAGYLAGNRFHQGILSEYGVDPSVFTTSTYDVYVNAYYAVGYISLALTTKIVEILNFIFLPPNLYASIFVFAVVVYIVYITFVQREKLNQTTFRFKLITNVINYIDPEKNKFMRALVFTGGISYVTVVVCVFLMFIAVFWFVLPKAVHDQGKTVSQYQIEKYHEFGCEITNKRRWSLCHQLRDEKGNLILQGLLAAQNNEYVAFYTGSESIVMKFPSKARLIKSQRNKKNEAQ